jgi:hypothetical protein
MKSRPFAAVLFLALAMPLGASAQVSDADRATARALAQQGQDALEKGDFAAAADRFGRADALVHAPTLMLGQAKALLGLGKLVSAHELYARIVREGAPAGSPPAFAKAVGEARKAMEAMEPRIPSVVINVKGSSAPKVTLDGSPVPVAALGVNRPVDPGKHVVRAEAEGFAPTEAPFMVTEGKSATVTVELKPAAAAPKVAPPPPPKKVDEPPPPPAKVSNTQKILGFAGLGVGAGALVMGGITGAVALKKHGDLAKLCNDGHCTGQDAAISSYHTMGTLSTVGFIAGGALAVTGVVLVVTSPKARSGKEASLIPLIGPGFVGAAGRF